MFANGCFITDGNHRFDDPDRPVPWQGFVSKGPTRVGDNVWCGANVVVASGVTIGERCVIGANSVVTQDVPAFSIAAGAPATVLRGIEYPRRSGRRGRATRGRARGSAQQDGSGGTGRSAATPSLRSVRTATPLTFEPSELVEISPPGAPAALVSPMVAKYAQPRTSASKITW